MINLNELASQSNITIAVNSNDLRDALLEFADEIIRGTMERAKLEASTKTYTISEAAKILKVSNKTIYNWVADGVIKETAIGGRRFITEKEMSKILKQYK